MTTRQLVASNLQSAARPATQASDVTPTASPHESHTYLRLSDVYQVKGMIITVSTHISRATTSEKTG